MGGAEAASVRILLVEDQAITAMMEKEQLEKRGYTVYQVHTGEEAVETALADPAAFDLILMDIDLGVGMDGTEAAKLINEDVDIPIVFLSAHTEPEIVERTEKIASYGYVVKDSGVTVLDSSIKMALALFRTNRELKNELAERKRIEDRLRLTQFAMDRAPVSIIWVDHQCRVVYANDVACESMGYTQEELLGMTAFDFDPDFRPEDWEQHKERVRRLGRLRFYSKHRKKNGQLFPVEVCTNHIEYHGRFFAITFDMDISDREDANARCRKKERFDRALSGTGVGVWEWDLATDTVEYSREWKTMLGYEEEELEESVSEWKSLWHPDDRERIHQAIEDCLTKKADNRHVVHRLLHKRDEWRWVVTRAHPIMDEEGKPVRFVGSSIELSEVDRTLGI